MKKCIYVCMYVCYVMYRYRIYEKDELYAYMHILNIYMSCIYIEYVIKMKCMHNWYMYIDNVCKVCNLYIEFMYCIYI